MIDPWNVYIQEDFTKFIDKSKVKIILEIGARECGYTQDIIDYYNFCEQVHCFECNPLTKGICLDNIERLKKSGTNIKRVQFNSFGISSKEERLPFYPVLVGCDYGSSSAGFFPREKFHSLQTARFDVDCTTIDDYCREQYILPDLLLMDIEGGELKALEGGKKSLHNVSYIIMETQDVQRNDNSPLRSEITAFLKDFGFKEVYTTCKGYFGDSIYTK
jgi:FkbM family methyltransferase